MSTDKHRLIPITDLHTPELEIYNERREVHLFHYYEPERGLFIAESPNVILRALAAGYEPLSLLMEQREADSEKGREILGRIAEVSGEIPVYVASNEVLSEISGFKLARGMLCAMHRPALPGIDEICKNARRIAVLENVVNPTNIGAIFRSAAALGMDAVLLTPGCSNPLYRRAIRVSMGTVFQISWTFFDGELKWPYDGMKILKNMGFKTAAMALTDNSVSIDNKELLSQEKLAIILGTEGEGLMAETIEASDYTVKIPMANGVDSLNVAAASAVAFWELGRKR